ncbi:hypothetical protein [Nitrospira sp. BLG_2]|uniref:hypothetical protein n=1 Tax=Nitrospira sp. BLG_2 TaxID=3397507 RepID=UPI003B9C3F60
MLRYFVRYWHDYYNENGEYHQTECQFSNKKKAVQFAQTKERALVTDLLQNRKLIFSK